ncbi:extracellular solute-binding protein [Terrarubrum flagellatum]|uniref:extracellular solute-binding protein n=1 Tax=Terrirubrum flagellatum TaxID=2895980 RepID=UPI003144D49B
MYALNRRHAMLSGAALALAAGSRDAFAQSETLTIYNGQHRQMTDAIVAAFTNATGIKVVIRQGESSQLANQLIEEGANSPADLFYSEQAPPIAAIDEKGLLAPASAEALSAIPANLASVNKTWLAIAQRCRVVAYNKAMVKDAELPKSILECATPAWKDRVGYVIRDGFQEQIMAIVKLKGRDAALAWLKGLKANGRLYNGNGAAMMAVENGEIATALINNYYWYGVAKERGEDKMKSALHYVAKGDPGALVNLSPAGVLKTAKNAATAQKFLTFMVSEEGQKAAVATYAEYPVRPGIVSPFKLKPLDEIGAIVTQSDIGGAQLAYDLEREAGIL